MNDNGTKGLTERHKFYIKLAAVIVTPLTGVLVVLFQIILPMFHEYAQNTRKGPCLAIEYYAQHRDTCPFDETMERFLREEAKVQMYCCPPMDGECSEDLPPCVPGDEPDFRYELPDGSMIEQRCEGDCGMEFDENGNLREIRKGEMADER